MGSGVAKTGNGELNEASEHGMGIAGSMTHESLPDGVAGARIPIEIEIEIATVNCIGDEQSDLLQFGVLTVTHLFGMTREQRWCEWRCILHVCYEHGAQVVVGGMCVMGASNCHML